jgi:hypothetical protein
LVGKGQKIIIIIVITGLHNKPHGCSASVASVAGPFTTKKKVVETLSACCSILTVWNLIAFQISFFGLFLSRLTATYSMYV